MKIVTARIEPPSNVWGEEGAYQAHVYGVLESGEEVVVVRFYFDEHSFTPEEFVGLTVEEARKLKHRKDVAYLQR